MEYAIVETGGKQYKVTPGMKLEIDSLGISGGETEFKNVLLHVSGDDMVLGTPYISGMVVKAKVVGASMGDKVRVSKFKGKSRYRRTIGFRSKLTALEILPFSGKATASKKAASK